MDYYLQQEYNDSHESDSDNNHQFYQFLIFTRLASLRETLVIDLDSTYLNERGRLTVCRLGKSI